MQNLILNNMQPNVQLMSGRTGALGSAPSRPLAAGIDMMGDAKLFEV
jgi:hypothetical protein